jgi:hypothetical protein
LNVLAGTGDFDADFDTDLEDYLSFSECMGGPDVAPPVTPPACLDAFDFDGDGDVDYADHQWFQLVFTSELP